MVRFCCSGVCSGVGSKPGSISPLGQPLGVTNGLSACERRLSPPLVLVTLITDPLRPCPSMLCSLSFLRRAPLPPEPREWRWRWLMIQQTVRPERIAPVAKAETADTTSRFTDTSPSGSSMKLSWSSNPMRTERCYQSTGWTMLTASVFPVLNMWEFTNSETKQPIFSLPSVGGNGRMLSSQGSCS